mgnify:CR=1 FL=1
MELSDIFHRLLYPKAPIVANGHFQSKHGGSFIAKCYLPFIGIPHYDSKTPFNLNISETSKAQKWMRNFNGKTFSTWVRLTGDEVIESRGPVRFHFSLLEQAPGKLEYRFKKLFLFGIRLPLFLSIRASAVCERISSNEWRFEVNTTTAGGRLIVKYWGQAAL